VQALLMLEKISWSAFLDIHP